MINSTINPFPSVRGASSTPSVRFNLPHSSALREIQPRAHFCWIRIQPADDGQADVKQQIPTVSMQTQTLQVQDFLYPMSRWYKPSGLIKGWVLYTSLKSAGMTRLTGGFTNNSVNASGNQTRRGHSLWERRRPVWRQGIQHRCNSQRLQQGPILLRRVELQLKGRDGTFSCLTLWIQDWFQATVETRTEARFTYLVWMCVLWAV